jgi:hypothetical protein
VSGPELYRLRMARTLETLEPRRLFTGLGGVVWDDVDSSHTFDEAESAFPGITVYLDTNRNGRRDVGEPGDVTDAEGRYRFEGLASGSYDVRTELPAGIGQVASGVDGSLEHGFDIEINYVSDMTPAQMRMFQLAAKRWEAVIVGDLPAVNTDIGLVDDIVIDASIITLDGGFGTLAQAEPTRFRSGSMLPSRGVMEFDADDIQRIESEGKLLDLVTHEMGHVLGFGTLWAAKGLIAGANTTTPRFIGPLATEAYEQLFNAAVTGVPVEGQGGPGTILSHWRETSLRTELMTGYSEAPGVVEPISIVTVQQFADLGYTVNTGAFDTWDPGEDLARAWKATDAGVRPFARRVVLTSGADKDDVDFALRANRAPVVTSFTINPAAVTAGENVVLSARAADPNEEAIYGVTFYRESNSTAGLQPGSDTYVATKFTARKGVFAAETATDGLLGQTTYYAVAVDAMLFAGRRAAEIRVYAPTTPPTRPNPLVVSSPSSTSKRLQWKDRSSNEIGFRVEVASDAGYGSVIRSFNVPADSVSALVSGLLKNTGYYFRVRAYNLAGASAYTRIGPA